MQAICEECGQPYKTTQSKYNAYKHHYCSRECVNRMRKRSFLHNFVEKNGQKWKLVDYPDKSCVIIKCKCCGGLRERQSCQIVSYSIICPVCEQRKKDEKERLNKEIERINHELEVIQNQREKLRKLSSRLEKGLRKIKSREKAKERRKQERKLAELKRERRIKNNGKIDKDISLRSLYERDKGICHLCGGHCDYSDHKVTEEGYFIAGLRYPSIDHVVPLSKGGTHTWENVKLACFGCNVAKGNGDGISPPIFANQ